MVVTLSQACCTCPQGLEGWHGLMVPQLAHLEAGSTSLGSLGPGPGAAPRASGEVLEGDLLLWSLGQTLGWKLGRGGGVFRLFKAKLSV